MAVLFSLWCVLESSILPHGSLKWNTLGYFINPLLLMGCQFYLFGKFVLLRLTFCIYFPLRALWHANLWLCSSTRRCVYRLVILSGLDDDSIIRQYRVREMEDKWMLDFDVDDPLSAMVSHGSYLVKEFSVSFVTTARAMMDQEVVPVCNYHVEEMNEESEYESFSESEEEDESVALINGKEGGCEKKEQKGDEQNDGVQEMQNYCKEEVKIEDRAISHTDHTQQQRKPVQGYQKVEEEERISVHDTHQRQDQQHHHQQQPVLDFTERGFEEAERITVQPERGQQLETTSHLAENIAAEVVPEADSGPANTDEFHMNYTRKMKELDQLNQELLRALGNLLNTRIEDQTFLFNIELRIKSLTSNSYMSGPVASDNPLLRKIISGLELVYVGQSCLSWEALQHQYHSFETYVSSVPGPVFTGITAENFQNFSVLLERFLENGIEGKWVWNYILERRLIGNLLQVPEVPGYAEANEVATRAEKLLMIINDAIKIFYKFLQANNNKPLLKLEKLFKLDSQVEDPNDIGLFDHLCNEVYKKKSSLKKFAKGRNSWRRRSVPFRDRERNVILFSMIDLELASRVLKMFVISTKQLQWCKERLNSIQLYEGRLIRNSTGSSFPVM